MSGINEDLAAALEVHESFVENSREIAEIGQNRLLSLQATERFKANLRNLGRAARIIADEGRGYAEEAWFIISDPEERNHFTHRFIDSIKRVRPDFEDDDFPLPDDYDEDRGY
jgi:hypothetical protein